MRIALITSNQRRHRWVAAQLASCGPLEAVICERKPFDSPAGEGYAGIAIAGYFAERAKSEDYWFSSAPEHLESIAARVLSLQWGEANEELARNLLNECMPDIVFLFGSSIIREPILADYAGRIVNMHLGLSPYYRGSGTNFWPLVDGFPECVGVTAHHATLKVDGGHILGQARPDAEANDTSHDLGCKSVIVGVKILQKIVQRDLPLPAGAPQPAGGKLCRRKDFTLAALRQMQANFDGGMMERYLQNKGGRDARYPLASALETYKGQD